MILGERSRDTKKYNNQKQREQTLKPQYHDCKAKQDKKPGMNTRQEGQLATHKTSEGPRKMNNKKNLMQFEDGCF